MPKGVFKRTPHSEETKKKMRESAKKNWSVKTIREKRLKSLRRVWSSPEWSKMVSINRTGCKHSKEAKLKMRKAHLGIKFSDERRRKCKKAWYRNQEFQLAHLKRIRKLITPDCRKSSGEKHRREKVEQNGYVFLYAPDHPFCNWLGKVREHRLVVEKMIGRYLKPYEKVHHIGKKTDNLPHMLMAFLSQNAHKRFERGGRVKPDEIIFDGRKIRQS